MRDDKIWAGGLLVALLLAGCSQQPGKAEGKTAVTINDLTLTASDLQRDYTIALPVARIPGPNGEPEWLSRVIERELLVQEGRRLGLDRDPEFMRSIERFWKEALLKQVVQRKAREISARVQVSEPEIQQVYAEWVKSQPADAAVESLDQKRAEIEKGIHQHKESEEMEKWAAELRQGAKVQVDTQALGELK